MRSPGPARRRILFVETFGGAVYDDRALGQAGPAIGGSETTLVRIACGLAATHHVDVVQYVRKEPRDGGDVRWHPWSALRQLARAADAIVVQRHDELAPRLRRFALRTPIFLWNHDSIDYAELPPPSFKADREALLHGLAGVTRVCLSPFHAANQAEALQRQRRLPGPPSPRIRVIPNPVVVYPPDPRPPLDRDKLVYCSSPTDRLPMILAAFAAARAEMPSLRLHLASPRYDPIREEDLPADRRGIVLMGSLPQPELHRQLSDALCLFYPQWVVPEAFGLVFAEAHALGTPALAHDFGAAVDLLTPDERLDARDLSAVVARVRAWRDGARPQVSANPALTLEAVLGQWRELLG